MGSPADYQSAFTVAAHDQSRLLAPFSSKGPNALGDVPYTKPNLSAPGMSILSTYNNGSYTILEGTSMAAPHVSGAVALLWSCNPFLIGKVDQTFQLLQNSADASPAGTCGAPAAGGGNYSYGYGFLDVYQAGQSACTGILRTYLPLIQNTNQTPAWPDPTQNGGFESGQVSWTESSTHNYVLIMSNSDPLPIQPYAGSWLAWLGGANSETSSIVQTIAIPAGRSVLHYWFASVSVDSCNKDFFKVFAGTTELNSETLCADYQTAGWVHRTLDLSPFAGTIQTLKFLAVTDSGGISSVMLDNISLEKTASLTGSIQSAPSSNLPR
jgi:hypothetical protein